MHANPKPPGESRAGEISSVSVLFARLLWVLVGPALFVLALYRIVTVGNGWFTAWDAAFGLVVAMMIGCRWAEQRSGAATTVTGEPSSPAQFRRYERVLLPLAAGLWAAANVLGNHVLT